MLFHAPSGLNYLPKRIVSLVPSQTELLHSLRLEDETVGITKFCVHPEAWFRTKTRIGGTKNVNTETIQKLRPDLIIANKEENVKEQVELLAEKYPVFLTDVNNLEDALQMIEDIGILTGKIDPAITLANDIKKSFDCLDAQRTADPGLRTAYIIWRKPYMTVGGDTFISDMLSRCGFENIFKQAERYPELNPDQLSSGNCQLLLLSSEPYPFKQQHVDELQSQLPDTKIILVDGEMFSWYGSRLLKSVDYFVDLKKQVLS